MLSGLECKTGWSLAEHAGEATPDGMQRLFTGTAGKITNCQLGVFLAYASPKGRVLVDRELYLPRSWTGDGQRLAAAGVPEGTGFRTKPQLLQLMIERGHGRDPVRLGHGYWSPSMTLASFTNPSA
jgi:DDE superfamily endonuclease